MSGIEKKATTTGWTVLYEPIYLNQRMKYPIISQHSVIQPFLRSVTFVPSVEHFYCWKEKSLDKDLQ